MDSAFSPERLRLGATTDFPRVGVRPRVPRHRTGERFLRGPIPLAWLRVAQGLPGKALHVAVELWYRAGLTRSAQIELSLSAFESFGITRFAAGRGLRALEASGLVSVARHDGRKPLVIILDVGDVGNEEDAAPPAGADESPGGRLGAAATRNAVPGSGEP